MPTSQTIPATVTETIASASPAGISNKGDSE
jgi:hypothetical protein